MKTFVKGFVAAVVGIIIFLALLVAWIELTDPSRASGTEDTAVTDTSGTGVTASGTAAVNGASGTENESDPISVYNAANAAQDEDFETFLSIIEPELKERFGDNLEIDRSERRIIITFWVDDLISDLSAGQIDDTTMDLWISKKEEADAVCTTYYNQLAGFGVKNGHVTVNLLNERDRDKIILSYEDGRLVFDGLPASHLQEQIEKNVPKPAADSATEGST